jgi:hypothetical protein
LLSSHLLKVVAAELDADVRPVRQHHLADRRQGTVGEASIAPARARL